MQRVRATMCIRLVIWASVASSAVADAKPASPVAEKTAKEAPYELTFYIVTTRRKPVVGAKVVPWAVSYGSGSFALSEKLFAPIKTDSQGVARVAFPTDKTNPEVRKLLDAAKGGLHSTALRVDHPDHPPWSAYIGIREQHRIMLSDSTTIEVRARKVGQSGTLRGLFPVLSDSLFSGADWSERDGVLTIRRVDLSGERPMRWLRVVHVPETGPAWFSPLVDLKLEVESTVRLNLLMEPGIRLTGWLSEKVPRPVKNGRIVANVVHGADFWTGWTWEATANVAADGRFVLESLPRDENLQLIALCDGWVSSSPTLAEVNDYVAKHGVRRLSYRGPDFNFVWPHLYRLVGTAITATVPMHRTANCEVTVVEESGRPLRDAAVSFAPNQCIFFQGSTILGTGFDSMELIRSSIATGKHNLVFNWRGLPYKYRAQTDERGGATVRDLALPAATEPTAPVATRFSVSHEGYASTVAMFPAPRISVGLLPGQTGHVTVRLHRTTALLEMISK